MYMYLAAKPLLFVRIQKLKTCSQNGLTATTSWSSRHIPRKVKASQALRNHIKT